MTKFHKFVLPFVVFLTGASILVIEVVATRILSPYFGNTIFTVSSVIGIVLAALSAGYYFGGKLADRHPAEKVFYSIILLSGLSVIFLHLLAIYLLPLLGNDLSIVSGPLISALILFFIPSLLLGTLSPFAIKLQEKHFPKKGIGSISGEIFFWSTLGSIFGSLSAGFILIPQFGISQIILAVALILIILGLIPLIKIGISKKSIIKVILVSLIGILLIILSASFKGENVIYSRDGLYEKITIYDGEFNGKPTRFFRQDHSNSGAMYLDSDELVFDYTKYYALYKVFKPDVKDALVIGGGVYSIPKALSKDLPKANIDVSEIEPSLFELAQKYFRVTKSEQFNHYTQDGRRLLRDSDKKYDFIFSDVYFSLFSIPAHFTTREFFTIVKDKLNKDGIFVANLIGILSRQEPSLILSEIKTFQSVFPNSYFFAAVSPAEIRSQNIIFAGYNSDKKIDFNDPQISKNENPIIQTLAKKAINLDRFEFSKYPLLSDNFSPVEYFTAKVLQKSFDPQKEIDGDEILSLIEQQLRYGPRYLSTAGHNLVQKFLVAEMKALTDKTYIQTWQHSGPEGQNYDLVNIVGRFFPEKNKHIILATHYDSKKLADKDPLKKDQAVPGANDSASGVAVLLELGRVLVNAEIRPHVGVDIVLFDGEEGEENQGGDYSDWKPLGSTYFAEHLNDIYGNNKPESGLVLDMVCDKDLRISKEQSSLRTASREMESFWNIAKGISTNVFRDQIGPEIRDDHTALNQAGIPSFLIIDFEYPPFHTTDDTLDKCSTKSLETIAAAVLKYVYTVK